MLGLENTEAQIRLRIQQMQQEAEHDRLVRSITSGRQPKNVYLIVTLGRVLALLGSRLSPAQSQAGSVGYVPVLPVSTACCAEAAG